MPHRRYAASSTSFFSSLMSTFKAAKKVVANKLYDHATETFNSGALIQFSLVLGAKIKSRTLENAIYRKNLEIVRALHVAGANLDKANWLGEVPLHLATEQQGTAHIAKYLIESGVKVNCADSCQITPLHNAVQNGEWEVIRLLIRKKARVNARDQFDDTPLHKLACCLATELRRGIPVCSHKIARGLIKAGANVNARDMSNETPLHSVINGHTRGDNYLTVIRELIKAKADLNAQDKNGKTPLQLATRKKLTKCIELLKKAGAKSQEANNTENSAAKGITTAYKEFKALGSDRVLRSATKQILSSDRILRSAKKLSVK